MRDILSNLFRLHTSLLYIFTLMTEGHDIASSIIQGNSKLETLVMRAIDELRVRAYLTYDGTRIKWMKDITIYICLRMLG